MKKIRSYSFITVLLVFFILFSFTDIKKVNAEENDSEDNTITFTVDYNGGYAITTAPGPTDFHYHYDTWSKEYVYSTLLPHNPPFIEYDLYQAFSGIDGVAFAGWSINGSEKLYSVEELKDMLFTEDTYLKAVYKPGICVTFDFGENGRTVYTIKKGDPIWSTPVSGVHYYDNANAEYCFIRNDDLYTQAEYPVMFPSKDNRPKYLDYWTVGGETKKYNSTEIDNLIPSKDITIYPNYAEAGFYTYDANGGKVLQVSGGYDTLSGFYRNGRKPKLLGAKNLVRDGYTFKGYKVIDNTKYNGTVIDASLTGDNTEYVVDGDVTFVAVWEPIETDDDKDKKEDKGSSQDNKSDDSKKEVTKYSNEWVDGKWYNTDGTQTYKGTMTWKNDATGWWIEDSAGWYPTNSWQKIDGTWYFFKPDGYMASSEYFNGYWFNKDGSWDEQYFLSWKQNSTGWWVEDKSGWWPASSWLKIDGYWYYFDASGYMVTNQYVDGWWIDADGVCR